ncbi:MAG: DUF2147 domain-containing protein [Alphaproteobacteria bacterium]|nr:MAG: DUF2147 domain-containing protein [Alphaproteobacteria bacterium]
MECRRENYSGRVGEMMQSLRNRVQATAAIPAWMRRLAIFMLVAIVMLDQLVLPARADAPPGDGSYAVPFASSVTGRWRTGRGGSLVEIFRCSSDGMERPGGPFLCGRIINAKRAEVEGHLLLAGFRPKNGAWRKGRIIDPRSRSTYRGRLTLLAPDRLEIRGCLLMFCRAQIWERVPGDFDQIPERGPVGTGNLPRPASP